MPNWQGLNQNLGDTGSSLGQWARQQNEQKLAWDLYQRQKDLEFQNALRLQQADPLYQDLQRGKLAAALKSRAELGEDISPYAGIFGGQPQGQPSGGVVNVLPSDYTSSPVIPSGGMPIVPVGGQSVSGDLYAPEYEITPFGKLRPKGGILKSRKAEEEAKKRDIEKSQAIEFAKPYADKEVSKIAVAESVLPLLDEVIAMVEKEGNIFGNLGLGDAIATAPFSGQSRLGAFAKPAASNFVDYVVNPFKKGITAGKGREIGNKIARITQLAFQKGGATLTANEITASLAGLNPEYKTEKEWLEGLYEIKKEQENILNMTKKKSPTSTISDKNQKLQIPEYNPATQKLQRNSKTGEYRVVDK
jgi:hypothetical protein